MNEERAYYRLEAIRLAAGDHSSPGTLIQRAGEIERFLIENPVGYNTMDDTITIPLDQIADAVRFASMAGTIMRDILSTARPITTLGGEATEDAVDPAYCEQAEPQRERSANDYQPGGDHYRRGGSFQHWDFVAKAGLDYYQGNATKYITRHRHKKGAVQDLEKALHYIAKARELKVVNRGDTAYLADFAKANNLNPLEQEAIHLIMICNWVVAEDRITGLLSIAGETLQHQQV